MIRHLRITVLMEHRAVREDLLTEHGFSLWVEADGPGRTTTRILFDVGQTDAFAQNASALGVDLSTADYIVLSHGHYDHTGGLEAALSIIHAPVCMHPQADRARFSHPPGLPMRSIGMPSRSVSALQARLLDSPCLTHACLEPQPLRPGIWLTGFIDRIDSVEHPQRAFSLDERGTQPDLFEDDLALVLQSTAGNIVLTGCCHAGVANTLRASERITSNARCAVLIGGLHLVRSSEAQIEGVLETLRVRGVQGVVAGHCTGAEAECALGSVRRNLETGHGSTQGPLCGQLKVGSVWEWDLSGPVPRMLRATDDPD